MTVVSAVVLGLAVTACEGTANRGGKALYFDGINDMLSLEVPREVLYGNWTLEFWVKRTSRAGLTVQHGNDCLVDVPYETGLSFVQYRGPSVNFWTTFIYKEGLPLNEQRHLSMVHTRAWNQSSIVVYKNAVEEEGRIVIPDFEYPDTRPMFALLGTCLRIEPSGLSWTRSHEGYLDEIRMWNRSMSMSEIAATMQDAREDLVGPIIRVSADTSIPEDGIIGDVGLGASARLGNGVPAYSPSFLPSPFDQLRGGPMNVDLSVGLDNPIDLDAPEDLLWLVLTALPDAAMVVASDTALGSTQLGEGAVLQTANLQLRALQEFEHAAMAVTLCASEEVCRALNGSAAAAPPPGTELLRFILRGRISSTPSVGPLFQYQLFGANGYIQMTKLTHPVGTVEFWFRFNGLDRNMAVWSTNKGNGDNHLMFFMNANGQNAYFGYTDYTNTYYKVYVDGNLFYNMDRQHFAFTFEEVGPRPEITCNEWTPSTPCGPDSTPNDAEVWEVRVRLYKNGVRCGLYPGTRAGTVNLLLNQRLTDPSVRHATIGQEYDGDSNSDYLLGEVTEVRWWDVIRTDAEIAANFNRTMTGLEPNLRIYLPPTRNDFLLAVGGGVEYPVENYAETATLARLAAEGVQPPECGGPPRPVFGQSKVICNAPAHECNFQNFKGIAVRRNRFPGIEPQALVWDVEAGNGSSIIPLPRQTADSIDLTVLTERPDLAPVESQELALVNSMGVAVEVQIPQEVEACGRLRVGARELGPGEVASVGRDEELAFEPHVTAGHCTFALSYRARDQSGSRTNAVGRTEVRVLPQAPDLAEVLAVDPSPTPQEGVEEGDQLLFRFGGPTAKPDASNAGFLLGLFDVSNGSISADARIQGCWSDDGTTLTVQLLTPLSAFSLVDASYAVRRGALRGANYSTVRSTNVTAIQSTGGFRMRPCPGQADRFVNNECVGCPRGQRLSDSGDTCLECARGFYAAVEGKSRCDACNAGEFQELVGSHECQRCAAGYFTSRPGSSACMTCARGTYSDQNGTTMCTGCRLGRYGAPGADRMSEAGACPLCPSGMTTQIIGASSTDFCVCQAETLRLAGEASECAPCPEGMECPVGSDARTLTGEAIPEGPLEPNTPALIAGYVSFEDDPLSTYLCMNTIACPGGPPSTCGPGHSGNVCSLCLEGSYMTTSFVCEYCTDNPWWVFVLFVLCVLLGTGVAVIMLNRNVIQQTSSVLALVSITGLLFGVIQAMGVFNSLNLQFPEPLRSLFILATSFSINLDVLKLGCVFPFNPVTKFLFRQLVPPGAVAACFVIVLLKKRFHNKSIAVLVELGNTVGSIGTVFFLSILQSVLSPYTCYYHPNGKASMLSSPSVLCFEDPVHAQLLVISTMSFILTIVPFVAVAMFGTLRYKTFMVGVSASSGRWIHAYRWLFFRFVPHRYYYGVLFLFRSLLITFVPIVVSKDFALQVMGMSMILLFFMLIQMSLRPWRASLTNSIDAAMVAMLLLMLMCGILSTNNEPRESTVLLTAMGITVVWIAGSVVVLGHVICSRIFPKPFYARFICHHKAGAAARARLLQLMLVLQTGESCFIDSDDLRELNELFDIVRCKLRHLVVFLTGETLTRPWCAGEITVAHDCNKKVTIVKTHEFTPPTMAHYANMTTYLDLSCGCLAEHGIQLEKVAVAFQWLLSEVPVVHMRDGCGRSRFEYVVRGILGTKDRQTEGGRRPSTPSTGSNSRCLVVSTDPGDDEATATGGILLIKIAHDVLSTVPDGAVMLADIGDVDSVNSSGRILVTNARAVVMIFTKSSLMSLTQLQTLVAACSADVAIVPVSTPNFSFPGSEYFTKTLPTICRLGEMDKVAEAIQMTFTAICVYFATHSSDDILAVQSKEILKRVPAPTKGPGKFKMMRTASSDMSSASRESLTGVTFDGIIFTV